LAWGFSRAVVEKRRRAAFAAMASPVWSITAPKRARIKPKFLED
jgi:hypothetical protein